MTLWQMTKLIAAAVAFESIVESCSGVGDVAIGKAEQLWFKNRSAGGREPMQMFEGCKCRSSPVVTLVVRIACWRSVCVMRKRATWEAEGDIPVVGAPKPLTSGEWVNAMRDAKSKCAGV